jgi:hypothetical protein
MKNHGIFAILATVTFALAGCAGTPDMAKRPQNLLSLDEAIAGAAEAVEARVGSGTEIALAEFVSPLEELSRFLNDELSSRLSTGGALTVLARGESLRGVSSEQQFQIAGFVSDESAAGFGRYVGAKVVISGTFSRFANFSQFSIRAVDVETAAALLLAGCASEPPASGSLSKGLSRQPDDHRSRIADEFPKILQAYLDP